MKFQCKTPEETFELGQQLGKQLVPSDIVLLYGDLGAGKTTLIQGICCGLELAPELPVRSPTFTLINEYQAKHSIYHIDLYRLDTLAEIENLGLEEYLFGDGITLIEWAEKLEVPRAMTKDQNPLEKNSSASQKSPLHSSNPFHISAHLEIEITPISNDFRHFNIQAIGLSQREWPNSTLQ
ncbi:MAG: tRNA (adenosine(37)-N6)-threonylcarbamoyltransferase complex ATPase subunit type 1 TsaE [Nitrospinae bacterium CG11_big_fil_rev_8_21_14_0_20_45_15]|nr:MAG: tRNA (adenosine(37)-N6)-threonylcarbamoyltransferase complex ATPase subunit type 1 TsaE [Nitrospinae bacterium CG11_big_fil_rev_8_21_14_0_20_45_15]